MKISAMLVELLSDGCETLLCLLVRPVRRDLVRRNGAKKNQVVPKVGNANELNGFITCGIYWSLFSTICAEILTAPLINQLAR